MNSLFSRRAFIRNGAAAALAARGIRLSAQAQRVSATLVVDVEKTGRTMPENFTGVSYESAQLAYPTFFSAENKGLVKEFRRLGPKGQLRLGG